MTLRPAAFSLTGLLKEVWPYVAGFVVTIGLYMFVEHKLHQALTERYNAGVEAGKREVVDDYANKAAQLRTNWAIDKGMIEYEAQQRLAAAKADADNSRAAADSLQRTINKIRSIAGSAGVSVGSSTTTVKAVDLLSDLLVESNRRANTYAEFADAAYESGRTCEIQYDRMRERILEQATNGPAVIQASAERRTGDRI